MAAVCDFVPPTSHCTLHRVYPHPANLGIGLHVKNLANVAEVGYVAAHGGAMFEFTLSGDTKQFAKLTVSFELADLHGIDKGGGHLDQKTITFFHDAGEMAPEKKHTQDGWLTFTVTPVANPMRFLVEANTSTIIHSVRVGIPPSFDF